MKKALGVIAGILLAAAGPPSTATAQEAGTRLGEVVVTATKTEKDLRDVTQSVTVVSGDEIRRSGAIDVATAVQNAASVHIADFGTPGSVQSISIRGAYSSQVLVLLDGIRMNSSRDGGFDLSFIPVSVEDIERIEIVRGPSSALYGSDAVGGVINIITRKPQGDRNSISASAGSHGYDEVHLGGEGRKGRWYYAVAGKRETSDGYRVNSDLYRWVFNGKLGYELSKASSLEFSANYLSEDVGSPGSTLTFFGTPLATPLARQEERNKVYSGAYRTRFGQSVDLKLSGYRKQDDLGFQDPEITPLKPAPTSNYYETTSDGGEAQLTWLLAAWNQLTAGYEMRRDRLNSFDAQNGTAEHAASLNAFYFQDEISIGDPLLIVVGGREDDHSVYGRKFSPKISGRYALKSTGTIFRASYGKSFRAPTFNDLYFNTSWAVGNPNLKPESAKEYEGSVEQQFGKELTVKIAGFDRKVTDLIQWNWYVFPMQVENIGKAHIRGLEIEGAYRIASVVSLLANYTYLNPVDDATGEKIYYTIPRKQLKGALTVFPEKNIYLTIEGRAVENYVKPGEPAWRYSVYDAKIAEKMTRWAGAEVFFAVTNIFDRNYEAVQGYPMPPKEIRGGVSLTF
jgi:outer membrane cobalamin receptor